MQEGALLVYTSPTFHSVCAQAGQSCVSWVVVAKDGRAWRAEAKLTNQRRFCGAFDTTGQDLEQDLSAGKKDVLGATPSRSTWRAETRRRAGSSPGGWQAGRPPWLDLSEFDEICRDLPSGLLPNSKEFVISRRTLGLLVRQRTLCCFRSSNDG